MASSMKMKKFRNESEGHYSLRMMAFRFLWNKDCRAIASFVEVKPYGVLDVIGVKKNGDTFFVDCIENPDELRVKNMINSQAHLDHAQVMKHLENLVVSIYEEKQDTDLTSVPELNLINSLAIDLSEIMGDQCYYWRMLKTLTMFNYHYVFADSSQKYPGIKYLPDIGYNFVHNQGLGLTVKAMQKASRVRKNCFNQDDLEKKMIRSLTHEVYSNFDRDIINGEKITIDVEEFDD